jgi:hypothetical protein
LSIAKASFECVEDDEEKKIARENEMISNHYDSKKVYGVD